MSAFWMTEGQRCRALECRPGDLFEPGPQLLDGRSTELLRSPEIRKVFLGG